MSKKGGYMRIEIPGVKTLELKNIFIDYNGTIAKNGKPYEGILEILDELAQSFNVFIITGDTFGHVATYFEQSHVQVLIAYTADEKYDVVSKYKETLTIGNGSIDYKMFMISDLSFCVIGDEGASFKAMSHADIIVKDIFHVIEMILEPKKIIATLKE